MEVECITREEHEEFRRRIEVENARQNKRLELIEDNVSQIITHQISTLTTMVEKTALTVDRLLKEQEQQDERLDALESRDGEKWRSVVGYVGTTVLGIVIGFVLKQIGIM